MYEIVKDVIKNNTVMVIIIGLIIIGFGVLEVVLWIEHIIRKAKVNKKSKIKDEEVL
jgi:hypothetical protein